MKKVQRIAALSLAALLTTGTFTGCGKAGEKPKNAAQETQQPVQKEPVPIKIFANLNPPEESIADKAWREAIEKATNTKISFEIPPSANYNERLNIMIAGGDYADVILFNDPADKAFVDSANNGVLVPITKYIEKSPNLKKYSYDISWISLKPKNDNEIFAIPRTTIQRADGFAARQDWLDAIGFKIPADNLITIEQFEEMMTKFTKEDPDKNGKADTYGWSASQAADGNIYPILDYPFGIRGWQKTSGEKYEYMDPQYSKENSSYKKALEFTAKLIKNGLVDPNFASIKSDAAKARFKQGITGAREDFSSYLPGYQIDASKINPNVKMTYISGVKDAEGKFQRPSYGTGVWGCWGVSSAAKDPAAAVSIFEWLIGDEGWSTSKNGIEGITYKNEGGKKVPLPEFGNYRWGLTMVRRNNDPEFFVKINMDPEYIEPVKKWIDIGIKANVTSMDYGYRPAAADKPALIEYKKQLDQTRAKILLGSAPASEWDKALDGWYKAGGEEYVQQMNEYIKKTVSKK